MSKPGNGTKPQQQALPTATPFRVTASDGGELVRACPFAAVVRTTKGVAVLHGTIGLDGSIAATLGTSQQLPHGLRFVMEEHKSALARLGNLALY